VVKDPFKIRSLGMTGPILCTEKITLEFSSNAPNRDRGSSIRILACIVEVLAEKHENQVAIAMKHKAVILKLDYDISVFQARTDAATASSMIGSTPTGLG
jgi:hypothetical protein